MHVIWWEIFDSNITNRQKLIIWVWMWKYVIIYSWRWNTSHTFGVVLIMPSKAEQSLMGCQTFNRSLSELVLQLPTFAEVLQNKTSAWQQLSAVPRLARTTLTETIMTEKHKCDSQNQKGGRTESHIPKQEHLRVAHPLALCPIPSLPF